MGEQPRPSIRFCHLIAAHVNQAFGLGLLVQVSLLLVTFALHFLGSDVFPADFTDVPLELSDEASYRRVKAWNLRDRDPNELMFRPDFFQDASISRHEAADILELYYEAPSSAGPSANLFAAETLVEISKFERSLEKLPFYQKFCVLDEKTSRCLGVQSILTFLAAPIGCPHNNCSGAVPRQEEVNARLEGLARVPSTAARLRDVLDKNTALDVFPIRTRSFRSYVLIAWAVYKDGDFGAPNSTKEFASNVIGPELWDRSRKGIPSPDFNVDFYYYNPFLYYDRLKVQVINDLMLATGSFLFVFFFLWLQTRSVFITTFGILAILSNFVGANLIYRYVFDFRYFGVFNVLSVFIILGIGVDDIFVFNDAWTATAHKEYASVGFRLSDAYKKSALSMFITSFTTTAAFVVNAFSPLLAISSFGLFSACLVVFNYVSVITFFPTVIAFHHIRLEGGCSAKTPLPRVGSAAVRRRGRELKKGLSHGACRLYKGLIWQPGVQALFLISLAAGLGFLGYSATRLRVDTEPVRLYIPSHPMGRSLHKRKTDFHPPKSLGLEHFQIYFVWGIKDIDRSMCHKTAWKSCGGKIVWDNNFDLNPYHAQRDLLWFCDLLRNMQSRDQKKLHLKTTDGKPEVACFINELDTFLEKEFEKRIYSKQRLAGLPTSDTKIEALMLQFPGLYRADTIGIAKNSYFSRFFETAAMHWLHAGYGDVLEAKRRFSRHGPLLGFSYNSSDVVISARSGNRSFVYGNRLRYAAVVVNTTLPPTMGYEEGLPIMREWEDMFERATLTSSALKGVAISLCLALPVLILSTDDVVIGGIATLIICATSVSVIGLIPLAGWKLGVLESLNLTLVVGLAIDYIVHVAEAYHLSDKPTRREKVDEILEQIGVSVISGAISTLGASLFMLFAQIAFFMQFGLFIFCTVGFSLLYSLGMFIVLLSLVGPETKRFSVSANVGKLLNFCSPPKAPDRGAYISTSSEGQRKSKRPDIDDDNISSGYDSTESKVKTETTDISDADRSARPPSTASIPFSEDSSSGFGSQPRGFLPAIVKVGPSTAEARKNRRPRSRASSLLSAPNALERF